MTTKPADMYGATVLITGGTGTFGSAFLDRCLEKLAYEVRVFSRDEKKQYDMAQRYRDEPRVKFIIGDIRDRASVDKAMYGVDYVFHAAAMKQVPSCERFPMEAIKTNVIGSSNVIEGSIDHGVTKVVCLSTDKAVYPTSTMGLTKAYMEKVALANADRHTGTSVCLTRFGNLIVSRGSVVPLFMEQISSGSPITITEPGMTRYFMSIDEAIDLVEVAFARGDNGELMVKKTAACTPEVLAKAVCRYMGKSDDYPTQKIGIRPGEKMHESLLSDDEAERASEMDGYIVVDHTKRGSGIDHSYRSDLARQMTVEEAQRLIESSFKGGA